MDNKRIAIKAALIRQMLASSNASIVTATLLALVLAYIQREVIATTVIIAWLSLVFLVSLSRILLVLVYRRFPSDEISIVDSRMMKFRLGVLAAGLVWGLAGIVMFPPDDPHHQMFLIFMLAGLTAGGVISYSADLIGAIGFSVLALLPTIIQLFVAGDGLSMAMSFAALLYLGFMIVSLRYINRNICENIILRLEASIREETASASEERYRLLLSHSPVGIIHYDTDLVVSYCNDRFAEILQNVPERFIGFDMKTLKEQAILPALRKALQGELGHYEGRYAATMTDVQKWISMTCAASRNGAGEIVGGVAIVQDITALHESHQQMYSLLNSMAEGAYGVDTNGKCEFVNRSFLRILGYEHADEIIGKHIHELIHHSHPDGSHYPASECKMYASYVLNREIHATDEVYWKKDGTAVPVEYWSQPIVEDGIVLGAITTFIDISDRKLAEAKIRDLAFYDTLTHLPNRRLLNDRLGQTIAASMRSGHYAAVMFLDLDNFKPLNDLHGHAVGDLLLVEVAHRLKGCVRQMDTVARFGGDEFVVILSELDANKAESISQAGNIAEKIRHIVAEPYTLTFQQEAGAGKTITHSCTTSIGVIVFIGDEATPDDLIKLADKAMYQAKDSGHNSIRFIDSRA